MAKALANRPGLSVDLEGNYDPAADAYALKRAKLAADVRKAIWTRQHQADPNIAPPDQLVITPEQSAAMIKTLFDQAFPPGTKFGTPLPQPPAVVQPPAPPQSFFKRVVAFFTFQGVQAKHRAEAENKKRQAAYTHAVASAEASGLPVEEMTSRLAETKEVTPDDLRALAAQRAQAVRGYFVGTGHIDAGRVFLAKGHRRLEGEPRAARLPQPAVRPWSWLEAAALDGELPLVQSPIRGTSCTPIRRTTPM